MIESIQNKHIKWLLALQKNRKNRMKEKLFVVEGIKIIEEIPNDWEIVHVFVSNSFIKENALFLNKIQITKNNIIEVSDKLFNTISDTVTPQGVLAVCKQKMFSLNDVYLLKKDLYYT